MRLTVLAFVAILLATCNVFGDPAIGLCEGLLKDELGPASFYKRKEVRLEKNAVWISFESIDALSKPKVSYRTCEFRKSPEGDGALIDLDPLEQTRRCENSRSEKCSKDMAASIFIRVNASRFIETNYPIPFTKTKLAF